MFKTNLIVSNSQTYVRMYNLSLHSGCLLHTSEILVQGKVCIRVSDEDITAFVGKISMDEFCNNLGQLIRRARALTRIDHLGKHIRDLLRHVSVLLAP